MYLGTGEISSGLRIEHVGGQCNRLCVDWSVGWQGGERCGGGGVGIDDMDGVCSSGVESSAVIKKNVQVGTHGLIVQVAEDHQFVYVFLLDGELERRCED